MTQPWPVELRLANDKATLTIAFDSGESFALPAEYLRVESPSAEVQGHAASQKQIVAGKHAVKMTKVGERPVPLPHHHGRDYGRGLTQSILKQSGIDRINEGKWNSPSRYISMTTKAIGLTSSKSRGASRQAYP